MKKDLQVSRSQKIFPEGEVNGDIPLKVDRNGTFLAYEAIKKMPLNLSREKTQEIKIFPEGIHLKRL